MVAAAGPSKAPAAAAAAAAGVMQRGLKRRMRGRWRRPGGGALASGGWGGGRGGVADPLTRSRSPLSHSLDLSLTHTHTHKHSLASIYLTSERTFSLLLNSLFPSRSLSPSRPPLSLSYSSSPSRCRRGVRAQTPFFELNCDCVGTVVCGDLVNSIVQIFEQGSNFRGDSYRDSLL